MEKEAPALFGLLLARAQYSKKVARGQDRMQGVMLSKASIRFLFGLRRDKEACARRFAKQMIGYEVTSFSNPLRGEEDVRPKRFYRDIEPYRNGIE